MPQPLHRERLASGKGSLPRTCPRLVFCRRVVALRDGLAHRLGREVRSDGGLDWRSHVAGEHVSDGRAHLSQRLDGRLHA